MDHKSDIVKIKESFERGEDVSILKEWENAPQSLKETWESITKFKTRFSNYLNRQLRVIETIEEIWKPVPEFEWYEVSNFGKVRSITRQVLRKATPTRKEGYITFQGRLLSCTPCIVGYPRVTLRNYKETKDIHVHRLVASVFLENPDDYTYVNHLDNNKLNNKVDNLEWCSQSLNCLHAFDIGANDHGIKHWKHKFTEDEVREIRHRLKTEKISRSKLAREYNVSPTAIRMIAIGKNWRRLLD